MQIKAIHDRNAINLHVIIILLSLFTYKSCAWREFFQKPKQKSEIQSSQPNGPEPVPSVKPATPAASEALSLFFLFY